MDPPVKKLDDKNADPFVAIGPVGSRAYKPGLQAEMGAPDAGLPQLTPGACTPRSTARTAQCPSSSETTRDSWPSEPRTPGGSARCFNTASAGWTTTQGVGTLEPCQGQRPPAALPHALPAQARTNATGLPAAAGTRSGLSELRRSSAA